MVAPLRTDHGEMPWQKSEREKLTLPEILRVEPFLSESLLELEDMGFLQYIEMGTVDEYGLIITMAENHEEIEKVERIPVTMGHPLDRYTQHACAFHMLDIAPNLCVYFE